MLAVEDVSTNNASQYEEWNIREVVRLDMPFAFFFSWPSASKMEYIFGLRTTNSAIGRPFLHLTQHIFVASAECRVRWRIIAGVIRVQVCQDVGVHVIRLDVVHQAVGVSHQQFCGVAVPATNKHTWNKHDR